MPVCRYFLEGRCKFGNSCRYEHKQPKDSGHSGSQQQSRGPGPNLIEDVATDVITAEKGKQWPFTSFTPFRGHSPLPGLDDASPEEIRLVYYESQNAGQLNNYISYWNELLKKVENFRGFLKRPSRELLQFLENYYNTAIDSENTLAGNIFGGSSQQPNEFSSNQPVSSSSSIFTRPSTFGSNNSQIFESSQQAFGSTQPQTNSPSFGQPSSIFSAPNEGTAGGIFQPNTPSVAEQSASIFAQSQPSVALQSADVFAQNQSSLFSSNPSSISNQSAGIFAPALKNSAEQSTSIFRPNITGGSNIFGQIQQPYSQSNLVNTAPTSNIFKKTNVPENNSGNVGSSNIFGQSSLHQMSTVNVYSKMEDLTEEEIALHQATTYLFGQIPRKPPTQEMCN